MLMCQKPCHRFLSLPYGSVSKPITINGSGVFPPINPSYFDVNKRATRFWPKAIWGVPKIWAQNQPSPLPVEGVTTQVPADPQRHPSPSICVRERPWGHAIMGMIRNLLKGPKNGSFFFEADRMNVDLMWMNGKDPGALEAARLVTCQCNIMRWSRAEWSPSDPSNLQPLQSLRSLSGYYLGPRLESISCSKQPS